MCEKKAKEFQIHKAIKDRDHKRATCNYIHFCYCAAKLETNKLRNKRLRKKQTH